MKKHRIYKKIAGMAAIIFFVCSFLRMNSLGAETALFVDSNENNQLIYSQQIDSFIVYADNNNFAQIISEYEGGTIVLTEDIIISEETVPEEKVFWGVSLPTSVQMGEFCIRMEYPYSLYLDGPLHFSGDAMMFDMGGRLYCSNSVEITSYGDSVTAMALTLSAFMNDTVFTVLGDDSIGIETSDNGIVQLIDSDFYVEGSSSIGIKNATGRHVQTCEGMMHVNGYGAVGLWLTERNSQHEVPFNIHVAGEQAVGVVVENGATFLPAGTIEVAGPFSIGILLQENANTKVFNSSAGVYFEYWEPGEILVSGEQAVGIYGEKDVYLEYVEISVTNTHSLAAKAEENITLAMCRLDIHEDAFQSEQGTIMLDTCTGGVFPDQAETASRVAYPILGENIRVDDFVHSGYNLEEYGLFIPMGYDLDDYKLPSRIDFCFYDPDDFSRTPIIIDCEDVFTWKALDVSTDQPGSYTIGYETTGFDPSIVIPGFDEGSIPVHIYDSNYPFFAYAGLYSFYTDFYFTPGVGEGQTMRFWASIDNGENWYDCTDDPLVTVESGYVTVKLLHPQHTYSFKLEITESDTTFITNVLQYRWLPGDAQQFDGGDRDGSDQDGKGKLGDWLLKWLEDLPPSPGPGSGNGGEEEEKPPAGQRPDEEKLSSERPPNEKIKESDQPGNDDENTERTEVSDRFFEEDKQNSATFSTYEIDHQLRLHNDQLVYTHNGMRVILPSEAVKQLNLTEPDMLSVFMKYQHTDFSVAIYVNDQPVTGFGGIEFYVHIPYETQEKWNAIFCQKSENQKIYAKEYQQQRLIFSLIETGHYQILSDEEAIQVDLVAGVQQEQPPAFSAQKHGKIIAISGAFGILYAVGSEMYIRGRMRRRRTCIKNK